MHKSYFLLLVIFLSLASTGSNAQAYLNSLGNLGIGTETPLARLHVYSDPAAALSLQGNDGWIGMNLLDGNSDQVAVFGFQNCGNGIRSLDLLNNKHRGMISFFIYDSTLTWPQPSKMVIDSLGRVGIGTTNPAEKLDVEGNLDMNQNQVKNMRIENRTSDPASPAVGQIWIRTDL
jgi:hypothetical protein